MDPEGGIEATRRRSWLRRAAVPGALCALLVASSACVGKTGRNDDYVAPGSGGGPSGKVVPHDEGD